MVSQKECSLTDFIHYTNRKLMYSVNFATFPDYYVILLLAQSSNFAFSDLLKTSIHL